MSVLLDALKRAALDKKKGQSGAGVDAESPALVDDAVTEPSISEPSISEPSVSEQEIPTLLEESVLEQSLADDDESFTELLDDDDWDTEELDELVSEELDSDELEVEALTTAQEDPDFEARKEQQELQFALMQAEEKREQERLEREHRQAEATREQERLRQEAEAQRVFEEEALRREKEEAEKEVRKQELLEQARKQAEEEEKRRAENETALTTLVHEGHAINRRQKQRSRFLYAVLLLTAGGAIIAYYLYLLGSQSDVLLRERLEEQVVSNEASTATSAPVIAESPVIEEQTVSVPEPEIESSEAVSVVTESVQTEPARQVLTLTPIERLDVPPSSNDLTEAFTRQEETEEFESATVSNESVARDQVDGGQEVVHVYHKAVPTKLSDTVNRAYHSYQQGDLTEADRLYRQALRSDPRNRDALLGAAAVAVDRGAFDEAARLYQIRLNDNPADSHARSALLALSSQTDFESSDIEQMIDASPQDAHLHFLKGYAHAINGEWVEAQAAFFDAHHWDQANADYAYNLAVSLDHLGQQSAAMRFYRQAIDLAQERKGVFSIDQARQRLAQLESTP